ncbi:MAG: hypothetical protein V1909_01540 [Candidatus Micrarchaeota archaeon]
MAEQKTVNPAMLRIGGMFGAFKKERIAKKMLDAGRAEFETEKIQILQAAVAIAEKAWEKLNRADKSQLGGFPVLESKPEKKLWAAIREGLNACRQLTELLEAKEEHKAAAEIWGKIAKMSTDDSEIEFARQKKGELHRK